MSKDWYRDHSLSPEASSDEEYRDWAYQAGAHIDLLGNVVWPDPASRTEPTRED